MSIKWMNLVWNTSRCSGNELLALLAIADEADDSGTSRADMPSLARKMRMTESRNATRVVRRLEESGELAVLRREGLRSTYYILLGRPAGEVDGILSTIHTPVKSTGGSNRHPCQIDTPVKSTPRVLINHNSINSSTEKKNLTSSSSFDDDDEYAQVLKACGFWLRDRQALKEQGVLLTDILAELARCYADPKVRKPYRIAAMNLLRGDRAAAEWSEPRALLQHIPEAILKVARPDLLIEEPEQIDTFSQVGYTTTVTEPEAEPEVWSNIKTQLAHEMPRGPYQKYVATAHAELDGGLLTILGPDSEWLSDHLDTTIRRLACGMLQNAEVEISFRSLT